MPSREALHKAADWLLLAGEGDEAISVYFTLGDHDCAARAISSRAEGLIDLGRWQALEEWLDRLPPGLSAVYPNFDYVRAEMTAARGDSVAASRLYDTAATRYANRNDANGASRSMLAASAATSATAPSPTSSKLATPPDRRPAGRLVPPCPAGLPGTPAGPPARPIPGSR